MIAKDAKLPSELMKMLLKWTVMRVHMPVSILKSISCPLETGGCHCKKLNFTKAIFKREV